MATRGRPGTRAQKGKRTAPKAESGRLVVDRKGRLLLPQRVVDELGIGPGEEIAANVEGRSLILRPRKDVIQEIRVRWKAAFNGSRGSQEVSRERAREAQHGNPKGA